MTVNEFVDKYNNVVLTKGNVEKFFKDAISKNYMPYVEKITRADNIARTTTHISDSEGKLTNLFKNNTIARNMLIDLELVNYYTDINIDFKEKITEQYDMLLETDILPILIGKYIPENEVKMFISLVQMAVDDVFVNEHDLTSMIETKIEAMKLSFDAIGSALSEVIENNPELIEKLSQLQLQ